jgi:peptidoglycan/LPS O-acetylase OafA/YrhL
LVHGFPRIHAKPHGSLWSLSVEEQFYLMWPSMVGAKSRRLLWCIAVAVILITNLTLLILVVKQVNREYAIWTNSFVQFYYFAVGEQNV